MQFQIYKMDPETHWELVMPDTSYTWLSAELLNYAHGNLPLGILFLLLFFGLFFVWSSFLEHSQIIDIFLVRLRFWGLWSCLWTHWLTMPVGYPMALLECKGNRDKTVRHKPVRWQWKGTGGKWQAPEVSTGSRAVVRRRQWALFRGSSASPALRAVLPCGWSSSGGSVKAGLGRSEVWSGVGAISRATPASAGWGRSSEPSAGFLVLRRYLLE